ncbi:uncharacterized protein MONBRDRAFT_16267 [Monosiga brevicollis MX1]|uniref:Nudix hydrolase domain-containing protein n=1 Tax=Monosiga brevicollis TaxID=81824 RepID=A9UX49_MONBE|nr:uncharacterized protein MONBRDRAFT_16267 [Monosiga brevicollis MX1]EDQ90154.1 predicted protein [Monosiga brevicollis MX1]|eukprot:XP_001744921.1 hypothetical protein [Monosiga brevicollis MX1]
MLQVGVVCFVRAEAHPGCILLGRRLARHSDGNPKGQGTFAAPGGHLEFGEDIITAAQREVREECGVSLHNAALSATFNVIDAPSHYHFIVLAVVGDIHEVSSREPVNAEPSKCEGWFWHEWQQPLPQPTFQSLVVARDQAFSPF